MVEYRELTTFETVNKIYREFSGALVYNDSNFARSTEGWRFYWGRDNSKGLGQWPMSIAQEMVREGKFLATYNFVMPIVDSIAGGLMKAPYNADFAPTSGPMMDVTSAAKDRFIIDKELTDWNNALRQAAIGGCVHQSTVELYINREYCKKSGNIGLRYRLPGTVIFDPNEKTGRHKDRKKCWVTYWLSPIQMMQMWSEKADAIAGAVVEKAKKQGKDVAPIIRSLAEMQHRMGDDYGSNTGIVPYQPTDTAWGTQYRVIAQYEMRTEKATYQYAMTNSGEPRVIPGDLTDPAEKIEWLNQNVPDWVPDGIFEDDTEEEVQYVTIICPELVSSDILESGRTEIQCGMLSFIPFSVNNINGEAGGLVDAIIDAQKNINYLESLLTSKIQTEGGGGSQFVDPEGFDNPQEMQKYIRGRNNPRKAFKLKAGYLRKNPNGPAVATQKSAFPAEITEHLRQMIETIMPRISKVSPAWQGRSEASNESGYLFRLKRIQSEIEQYTLYESWRQFHNELGEAWIFAAANWYGDGKPREMYNTRTKKLLVINERIWENGKEVIRNDFSLLKHNRHRVIITESEDSPTRKYETMTVAGEAMRALPQTMSLTITKLGGMVALSIDKFTPEDQEEMKRYNELELMAAEQSMKTNMKMMRLQELNAEQQIAQLEQLKMQQAMMGAAAQGMPGKIPGAGGAPALPPPVQPQGGQAQPAPKQQQMEESVVGV